MEMTTEQTLPAIAPALPAARAPRLRIIHNPTAGGARWRRYGAVLERLAAAGAQIEELATGRRGDAEAYAAALGPEDCDRLVVAGGDGTVNEAINGLLANRAGGRALPLAVLPLGTANVLALEIGLSTRPQAVARYILEGIARPVALGEADGRAFCLMAGIGFDAHVVAGVDARLKRRLGKLAYVWHTLRQLAVYDFPRYRVAVDEAVFSAASAVVCNARFYGGRYVLAPDAQLEAASLEVCLFERPGRLRAAPWMHRPGRASCPLRRRVPSRFLAPSAAFAHDRFQRTSSSPYNAPAALMACRTAIMSLGDAPMAFSACTTSSTLAPP